MLIELSVSIKQGTYHTSILQIRQILLLETALSLVFEPANLLLVNIYCIKAEGFLLQR